MLNDSTLLLGTCTKRGSVAEWLACWTQAQKGPGSTRSRVTVLGKLLTYRCASERFRKWGYKFVRTLYNLVVKVVCLKFWHKPHLWFGGTGGTSPELGGYNVPPCPHSSDATGRLRHLASLGRSSRSLSELPIYAEQCGVHLYDIYLILISGFGAGGIKF